jgi:hypothetical protein
MPPIVLICLACGAELATPLAEAGSLRCHDCRGAHAPLRGQFAERQRAANEAAKLSHGA